MKCKGILHKNKKLVLECPLMKTCERVNGEGDVSEPAYSVKHRKCDNYIPTENKKNMYKKVRIETKTRRFVVLTGKDNVIIKSVPANDKLVGVDVMKLCSEYSKQIKFTFLSESESDKIYEDDIESLIAQNKSIGKLIDKFELEV